MEKRIRYREIDLVYRDLGEGPCIVLLHGYLESGEIWNSFAALMGDTNRLIIPDLPGHGASGTWGNIHTMEELAHVLHSILEKEGIGKIFLAGHSMGAYVTLAFAALFPDKLWAYALVHSTPFADTEEKRLNRDREISLVRCGRKRQIVLVNIPKAFADSNIDQLEEELEHSKLLALRCPDDGIVALLNGMKERSDRSALLANQDLPLLLIGGMKDNYIPEEVFDSVASLAPHARVVRLEESGHMGFIEEPERVAAAFRDMITFYAKK
jgi:pimeloyl-ACP methyl ester carboxylesterase